MTGNLLAIGVVTSVALTGLLGTKGNGKIREETREAKDFTGVQVSHGIHAVVTIGPQASVKLKGDDNLLPLIKVAVRGGQLEVKVDHLGGIEPTEPILLTVVIPKLWSVGASGGASISAEATPGAKFEAESSGGGRIAVKGIHSEKVKVETSGGSHVTLAGTAKSLEIDMSGGSTVKAEDLPADSLELDGSGGSRAYATIASRVTGDLSGGSTVHLKGHPTEHRVDTSGGSEIIFAK